jgi:hypothetical protein
MINALAQRTGGREFELVRADRVKPKTKRALPLGYRNLFFLNHDSVLNTFSIPGHGDDDYELPYLYWIPNLHKTLYKETLLVPKCSTNP